MNNEIKAVVKLPALKRYGYFIKKVADFEEVWGLYDGGWAMTEDSEGNQLVPFWPKREFADLCNEENWEGYKPKKIDLDVFIDKWIPGMKNDGSKIAIFWYNNDSIVVDPERLLSDLEEELENY
ncbi:hypothetical protein B5V89_13415 [Heyndrickxia sporothermodurans]|uniref:DUF2750 domain-containing protein n=1 Tax=Heyndrickxia sporothermodurans TaxID=46224 RepID=UPI000D36513D|nr:DUF2750 domain-containing protein [Heyndrickxia sporothermodurans]PTY77790.1 hypothetical protein B5V89_13415 [Heyndrickxia sporothermodurans]